MDNDQLKKINYTLIDTFLIAGERSIELRKIGLKKEIKSDNTPVTNGDIEVNNILTEKIKNITSNIPIVSEESSSNKSNNNLNDFWLIDPIDGTHDYINGKDEFTLNAALIINKKPKIGIIYAPAKKRLFYTYGNGSSFELINNKEIKIKCEKKTKINQIKAVSYSEKLKPLIADFHNKFGVTDYQKMKSSLKFCVIAAGEYDGYVAEPRASEWDIAASDVILSEAGGFLFDYMGNKISYETKFEQKITFAWFK